MITKNKRNGFGTFIDKEVEGCKRLTIPMEEIEHISTTIEVLEIISSELKRIASQRVSQQNKLLHARFLIKDANQHLKGAANKDIHKFTHYKGAV
jgi:hypothetical protein